MAADLGTADIQAVNSKCQEYSVTTEGGAQLSKRPLLNMNAAEQIKPSVPEEKQRNEGGPSFVRDVNDAPPCAAGNKFKNKV